MNTLTCGFEDLNDTFPKFDAVSGAVGFETTAPLYGRASAKFDQSQAQYLEKAFPSTPVVSWQGFHFKASVISACGLLHWLVGSSSRGDIRFNASSRKLEARVNGSLVSTGSKIFDPDTLYHLQIYLTVNGSYQYVQVKANDGQLFALNYFLNSGASPASYDTFRWGPFLGGGSGTLLIDDIVVNDPNPFTGGDYSWPGRIAITDAGPTGEGTPAEWEALGAASVYEATDELNHDGDTSFAHTNINRKRHSIVFSNPLQPVGGILEAVGFDVSARVSELPIGSEEAVAKVKLRFQSAEAIVNEVQTITVANAEAGDEIQFGYELENSPLLAFDISIVDMQAEADSIFGVGGVVVSGTPGASYVFTFASHWSQTRMLLMNVNGIFNGSAGTGDITVARTTPGIGIYEAGEPEGGYLPLELNDDALTDAYPEALSDTFESRSARRRVALDGGLWTRAKANAVKLVMRSDLPFAVVGGGGGALNEGAINEEPL